MLYWLIPYCILGIISFFFIYMTAWGWADVSFSKNKPWYENVLVFFLMLFGYSFSFAIVFAGMIIGSPFLIVGYFASKKEEADSIQKKIDDKRKFEEWKALPR